AACVVEAAMLAEIIPRESRAGINGSDDTVVGGVLAHASVHATGFEVHGESIRKFESGGSGGEGRPEIRGSRRKKVRGDPTSFSFYRSARAFPLMRGPGERTRINGNGQLPGGNV